MRNSARCTAELDGLVDDLDLTKRSMLHRCGHTEMLDLRVCEDFIHSIDRTAGYACLVQHHNQIAARMLLRDIRDGLIEGEPVLERDASSGKKRVVQQMSQIQRLAKAREDVLAEAAILMWPSRVGKTPVGMLVGWSLRPGPGRSFAINQRAAWKSNSEICAPSSDDCTH